MGEQNSKAVDDKARLKFTRNLLDDIEALELMLQNGEIESGITRIGAEQEFCLVNENWRPTDNALSILEKINDHHFTTELAKYNLEINLDPEELRGGAFSKVESQLTSLLEKARIAATEESTKILLTGILPTISTNELSIDYMTPMPRYYALNQMLRSLRGSDFRLNLFGVDELSIKHNSVMFEACNTSFQMHLQINPNEFAENFNWAQAIAGPVLGICANSPLLLGRELWAETRIALFQQSIDTRGVSKALKDQPSRVAFGDNWVSGSIADLYKNEIARHKVVLTRDFEKNALSELSEGRCPKLEALSLHNGTVYSWNRPCYGVSNGRAHIRIENRYIPAGPSVIDEIANFAFWIGLMVGRPSEFDNIHSQMDFKDAKSNFIKAARNGKESIMSWMGELITVKSLIIEKLLPICRTGLLEMKINASDINRYLNIIEQRAEGTSGNQWIINNYRSLKNKMKNDEALVSLVSQMHQNQLTNLPVNEWPNLTGPVVKNQNPTKVGHVMTTQVFTAYSSDTAELTLSVMKWKSIHHLPIVDKNGKLVGLLTQTHVRNFKADNADSSEEITVENIMVTNIKTTGTSTTIESAISLMKKLEIGCLPVTQKDELVGIITIKDLINYDYE